MIKDFEDSDMMNLQLTDDWLMIDLWLFCKGDEKLGGFALSVRGIAHFHLRTSSERVGASLRLGSQPSHVLNASQMDYTSAKNIQRFLAGSSRIVESAWMMDW